MFPTPNEKGPNGSRLIPDLLWYSSDSVMVIDNHRKILAINPAMERMFGRRSEEVSGKSECGVLFSCQNLQGCSINENPLECPGLRSMASFQPVKNAEYAIKTADNKTFVVSASYTPIQLPGQPVWALAILRDITLRKREELRLMLIQESKTDPLTRMPNRAAFMEILGKELRRAVRYNRPMAVVLLDADGFRDYNKVYGRQGGDELLRTMAMMAQAGRLICDFTARYGSDEFALLLPETGAVGAVVVSEKIRQAISHFPFVRNQEIATAIPLYPPTVSLGIALFPEDGDTPEELLAQAERRLQEAKRHGGNQVVGPPPYPEGESAQTA